MAHPQVLIVIFIIISVTFAASAANSPEKHRRIIIPVVKEHYFGLYYAVIGLGSNPTISAEFGLELGSRFSWFVCSDSSYNSSSYTPIPFGSPQCKLSKQTSFWDCGEAAKVVPRCSGNSCGVSVYRFNSRQSYRGGLAQDVMSFISTPDGLSFGPRLSSPPLIFACVGLDAAFSLPYSAHGVLGLSRNKLSLPSQLFSAFKLTRKFALCLPSQPMESSRGSLLFGGGPYLHPPFNGDVSVLFATTPLLINPFNTVVPPIKGVPSDEYFIDVKSIEIDGKTVPFKTSLLSIDEKGKGGTKIGPEMYSYMHSSIYRHFRKAFVAKAKEMKMVLASPIDQTPFNLCFDRKNITWGVTGPDVPVINLVLQTGKWRLYGTNSMWTMYADGVCLAFLDAGSDFQHGIMLGWHLMEDTVMEFDLESSMFSVTSSLLPHNTSCSRVN